MSEHTSSHEASTTLPTESLAEREEKDPIVVTSVSDFIKKIGLLLENCSGTEIFYRGQASKHWKLQPSIFRTPNGVDKEHLLFRDMVAHTPQSFSSCKSALDYLVQMQHYELPTRLLDVSTNPLVALYFACVQMDNDKKDNIPGLIAAATAGANVQDDPGAVSVESTAISMAGAVAGTLAATGIATHTAVSVTSALVHSLCDREDSSEDVKELLEKTQMFSAEAAEKGAAAAAELAGIDGVVYLFSVPAGRVKHYDSDTVSVLANLAKCKISRKCCALSTVEAFNEQPEVKLLLRQIKEEKPYFQPLIRTQDLTSLLLVKAKNTNQRITNQMGAFFLFGLGRYRPKEGDCFFSKKTGAEVPKGWIKGRLFVHKDSKDIILQELAQMGITESYLFPEMDKYAKELKKKYKLS